MSRILVLGSALLDIYLMDHDDLGASEIAGRPLLGEIIAGSKVDIDRLYYCVGGGGLNAAVSLSRQGHEVVLMANIARDTAGETILTALDEEEIDNSYLGYARRGGTGTSVVLLDSASGERTVLTYRGASGSFVNFSEGDMELVQPDWLYITTLRGDFDTLERFLMKAHEMGVRVMLNPGGGELKDARRLLALLAYVDVLLVNKEEAAALVSGVLLTELAYRLGNYVPVCIITDGAMGGVGVKATRGVGKGDSSGDRSKIDPDNGSEASEMYRFGIYEDVKVRDATGAGDAFGAGFLSAYMRGFPFSEALKRGSANSTAVVQAVGATTNALYGDEELHPMPMQRIEM